MKTSFPTTLFRTFFFAAAVGLFSVPVMADDLVQPAPGGGEKPLLNHDGSKGDEADGAIIRDKECAKKHFKGKMLKAGVKNPAYVKCVKDKLESVEKTGDH